MFSEGSCFGGCKVNLQTLACSPPSSPPAPSPPPSISECFRPHPKRLGSLRQDTDSAPNTADSLRAPRPDRTEPSRASPNWAPSTFPASAGRCPPLATPETSSSSVAGASTGLWVSHCWLQTSEVLKRPPSRERGGAACIYRSARAPDRCNMHLVAKSNSPGPASPSIWVTQAQEKPQAKLPLAQKGAASRAEGASAKKAPGSSRTKIRTCQADGKIVSESLLPTIMAPPRTRLSCLLHMQDFLHLGSETASVLRLPLPFPPSHERGFYFPLFPYAMQLLRLFCQVEK